METLTLSFERPKRNGQETGHVVNFRNTKDHSSNEETSLSFLWRNFSRKYESNDFGKFSGRLVSLMIDHIRGWQ